MNKNISATFKNNFFAIGFIGGWPGYWLIYINFVKLQKIVHTDSTYSPNEDCMITWHESACPKLRRQADLKLSWNM